MKKLLGVGLLAMALVACGGGGSTNPGPIPSTPTPAPVNYQVKIHWAPASTVGLAGLLVNRNGFARIRNSSGGTTVIAESGNGGGGMYDPANNPAYVTASVSPEPSPGVQTVFTTTSNLAVVNPTPSAVPNPSASPAALIVPVSPNIAQTGATVSATVGGVASATDNLMIIKSFTALISNNGAASSADFPAFTFDSNCNAVGQASTTGADLYISGPISGSGESETTIHYPNGGITIVHGYDISTLTASDWQNASTSIGVNEFISGLYDTLIFKAGNGKTVVAGGPSLEIITGNGGGTAGALIAGYTCLN